MVLIVKVALMATIWIVAKTIRRRNMRRLVETRTLATFVLLFFATETYIAIWL